MVQKKLDKSLLYELEGIRMVSQHKMILDMFSVIFNVMTGN